VDFDPISEWIAHKETLPWSRSSIVSVNTSRLQPGAQLVHVCALNAEVPLRVCSETVFLHG
jgi:hypothetical protein